MNRKVYVIGSLKNPEVMMVAARLRAAGHEVFEDWIGAGPEADMYWQAYEQIRGRTFVEALAAPFSQHVFEFDYSWLHWADTAVLVMPAGKSAHLELGYLLGRGCPGYILLDGEPDKWDQMYNLATGVTKSLDELVEWLA